jgi:hypothetical protein
MSLPVRRLILASCGIFLTTLTTEFFNSLPRQDYGGVPVGFNRSGVGSR